jgi:YHS domain-containing protein
MRSTRASVAVLSVMTIVGLMAAGCGKQPEAAPAKSTPAESKAVPAKATPMPAAASKPATTAITQKLCPVMGGAVDPNVWTEYQGKKVYFCCKECIPKFKQDPAKYMAKLK